MSNDDDQFELEVPIFIELKPSSFANDLGVYCTRPLNPDLHLGHFKGKTRKVMSQCADPNYVWTILSSRQAPLFYIDASDPKDSNWLRFIRSTSDPTKYNTICMQQNQQINYFTYKEIKLGEELLTYLPGKKKKPRKNMQIKAYKLVKADPEDNNSTSTMRNGSFSDKSKKSPSCSPSLPGALTSPPPPAATPLLTIALKDHSPRPNYLAHVELHQGLQCTVKRPADETDSVVVGQVLNDILDRIEGKAALLPLGACDYTLSSGGRWVDLGELLLEDSALKMAGKEQESDEQQAAATKEADEEDEEEEEEEENEEEEESGKCARSSPTPSSSNHAPATKTYTCQLCKKQFDQRFELSKHQCIEQSLKLLKKKKELRKKKWREAHWKRKIDLSYIETTSLTVLAQNVADNLSFCIDGTSEDLRAYSREVKDYLNTEVGSESQPHAALRSLGLLDKCLPASKLGLAPHCLDALIQRKADAYFTDCVYTDSAAAANYQCKTCRCKKSCLSELVQHQRECHGQEVKTTFDFYERQAALAASRNTDYTPLLSSDLYSTSAVGCLASDPFAYIINLYWDQKLQKKCEKCGLVMSRPKYRKHACINGEESASEVDGAGEDEEPLAAEDEGGSERAEVKEDLVERLACCEQVVGYLIDAVEKALEEKERASERRKRPLEQEQEVAVVKKAAQAPVQDSSESEPAATTSLRMSPRIRRSNQKPAEDSSSKQSSDSEADAKARGPRFGQNMSLVTVRNLGNRKIHTCVRCGLEFTSANSVFRHQEKSCLRVRVINLKPSGKEASSSKNKCPICSCLFYSTHRLSIHIYKHHKNLLGAASQPATAEARRLNEIQLKKLESEGDEQLEADEAAEGEEEEEAAANTTDEA